MSSPDQPENESSAKLDPPRGQAHSLPQADPLPQADLDQPTGGPNLVLLYLLLALALVAAIAFAAAIVWPFYLRR